MDPRIRWSHRAIRWRRSVALLLDAGGLADPIAQVVELGTTYVAAPGHFDALHDWSVQREDPLDAHSEAHLADGEGFTDAAAAAGNDHAFIRLYTFLPSLNDAHIHPDGIAGAKYRDVIAQVRGLDFIENVHRDPPKTRSSKGADREFRHTSDDTRNQEGAASLRPST